jgi:hypothetical protein
MVFVIYKFCSLLLIQPLKCKYSNHPTPTLPHYKYFPDDVTPNLIYILIMNTALFEETL